MPPESLWVQYSVVGILILAAGVMTAAFYRLWKDLLNWFEIQDAKRDAERERQRKWQAEQDLVRDQRWHDFLKIVQSEWNTQNQDQMKSLDNLINRMEILIISFNQHDTWTRAKSDK